VRLPPFARGRLGSTKKNMFKKIFSILFWNLKGRKTKKVFFHCWEKKLEKKKYFKKNREYLVSNEASVCSYTLPPPNSPPLIRLLHLEKERKGKIKFRFLIIIIIICVRVCVCVS
jgi:hypothetical protein